MGANDGEIFSLLRKVGEGVVRIDERTERTERAMMDTLTRRIYRNQGTGAFTFGNDLKYPIPA